MPFEKGSKKTGGRKKGTTNKATTALKDAIMNAFEKVGGQAYLERVAEDDPKTFLALLAKVLPAEIKADVTTHRVLVKRIDLSGKQDGDE